jgi:hypothetical protein
VIRVVMSSRRELIVRITGRMKTHVADETSTTASGTEAATRIAGAWLAAFERARRAT